MQEPGIGMSDLLREPPDSCQREQHVAGGPSQPAEHFIPMRKSDLFRLLAKHCRSPEERAAFRQVCQLVEATFHFQYHERLEELKDAYAGFNPDADPRMRQNLDDQERDRQAPAFFEMCVELLQRANYRRLSHEEISEAVGAASDWGVRLRVDFDAFERLEVFGRGDQVQRRLRRNWLNFYRLEQVEVPLYQRLVVVFRLRDHDWLDQYVDTEMIYLKIFKNIPKIDLDMLLPGTRIRMTLLDRSKILLPTLSGVAVTFYKVFKGAVLFAIGGIWGILAFLVFVGGTIGYGLKSFFGYLHTKDKYQLSLTRNLYYQNLDNNAGVLFRLLDEAEEQECREAILAFFLLWQEAGTTGWTQAELDRRAERFLLATADLQVDFEAHDAVDKLLRLGIARRTGGDRLVAVPIRDALVQLDRAWDGFFDHYRGDSHPPHKPHSHGPVAGKMSDL